MYRIRSSAGEIWLSVGPGAYCRAVHLGSTAWLKPWVDPQLLKWQRHLQALAESSTGSPQNEKLRARLQALLKIQGSHSFTSSARGQG